MCFLDSPPRTYPGALSLANGTVDHGAAAQPPSADGGDQEGKALISPSRAPTSKRQPFLLFCQGRRDVEIAVCSLSSHHLGDLKDHCPALLAFTVEGAGP